MKSSGKFTRAEIIKAVGEGSVPDIIFKAADKLGGELPDLFTCENTRRALKIHIPVTIKFGETVTWRQNNVITVRWADTPEVPS